MEELLLPPDRPGAESPERGGRPLAVSSEGRRGGRPLPERSEAPADRPPPGVRDRPAPPPPGVGRPEEERRSAGDIGPGYRLQSRRNSAKTKKGDRSMSDPLSGEIRRRPTLPGSFPPSTIGAEGLNFRVRNGNGCDPFAVATEICCQLKGCACWARRSLRTP